MASSDRTKFASRPPGAANGDVWDNLDLPLRECGEIAALRLSSALSETLAQAAEQLFQEATQALTPHEREAFVDAADFARQHRHGMVYDFMKHFEQRYLRACQNKPNSLLGHVIDFDVKELQIVEHHLLDDSLEPGKITEAIQNSCWKTLQMLTSQYRDLLDCQDLMPNDLPLGPKVIEAAVSDAIRDQPWRHKAKHRLASAIRWGLAARVNLLYSDLVELLKARDLKAFAETENTHGRDVCLMEETGVEVTTVVATPVASQDIKPPVDRKRQVQEHAAEASNREVVRCLGSSPLPHAMADFLARHWRDYLILACIQEGQDSPVWREGVRTMDDLVWSLSAKTSREDVVRLKEGLPDLLRRLSQGMDALALPQSERDRFLISLVKHHSDAVQQCAPSVPMASPTLLHPQDAATQAPLPIISAPEAPSAPPSVTLPDMQPANEERRPDPGLAEIKVGTWLEFLEPDGNNKELKLAWVSPHRNLYLLTNRRGERALSLMAEDFAARLQEGRARVIRPAKTPSNGAASGKSSKKTA